MFIVIPTLKRGDFHREHVLIQLEQVSHQAKHEHDRRFVVLLLVVDKKKTRMH